MATYRRITNFKKFQIFKVNVTDYDCKHNGKYIVISDKNGCDCMKGDGNQDYFYKVLLNDEVLQNLKELRREMLEMTNEEFGFGRDSIFSNSLKFICQVKPTKKN